MPDRLTATELEDAMRGALRKEKEEEAMSPEALLRRGHAAADEREADEVERLGRRLSKNERRAARNPDAAGEER